MQLQGIVQEQKNNSGSIPLGLRQLPQGDLSVSEIHGRYFEQGRAGNMFTAAGQAATAVSVGLSTTYTGLVLYNPPGSGVILVPNKIKVSLSAAPVASSNIGLIAGFSATGGVTALTTRQAVQSSQIGNSSVGKSIVLTAATIVTPTWLFELYDSFTVAALPPPTLPIDLEGLFQILPGGFIAIGATSAVVMYSAIAWEEVPITV